MKNLYMLNHRLAKLEKLLYERTIGRGGQPSNAYLIWQFLVDNGPSTSAAIKANFPAAKRASISSQIVDCTKADCIRKVNGDRYEANVDYVWDDVGSLASRVHSSMPSVADIERAIANNEVVIDDKAEEVEEPEVTKLTTTKGPEVEQAIINFIGNRSDHNQTTALSNIRRELFDINVVTNAGITAKIRSMVRKGLLNEDGVEYTLTSAANYSGRATSVVAPEPEIVEEPVIETPTVTQTEPEIPSVSGAAGDRAIIQFVQQKQQNGEAVYSRQLWGQLFLYEPTSRAVTSKVNSLVRRGLLTSDWFGSLSVTDTGAQLLQPRERAARTRVSRRTASTVGNIWSTKLSEVRTAIENGANVEERNDKLETPLLKIFSSKSSDTLAIMRLLLEHGANPNVSTNASSIPLLFKAINADRVDVIKLLAEHGVDITKKYKLNLPCIFAKNHDRVKDDAFKYLVNQEIMNNKSGTVLSYLVTASVAQPNLSSTVKYLCDTYMAGICAHGSFGSLAYVVDNELANSSRFIVLKSMIDNGVFPTISSYVLGSLRTQVCEYIYKFATENHSNVTFVNYDNYISTVRHVCAKLNKSDDFLDDALSTEVLQGLESFEFTKKVIESIRDNNVKLLKRAVATNRKDAQAGMIIEAIANIEVSKEITRLACKILTKCKDDVDLYAMRKLAQSTNEYLITWAIDQGFEGDLVEFASYLSSTARKVLQDNDIPITGTDANTLKQARADKRSYGRAVATLINAIEEDNYRYVQDLLNKTPALIDDEQVIDVINDAKNNDSFSARELRKQLANRPKNKYDF